MRKKTVALLSAALLMPGPVWAGSKWATHGEIGLVAARAATTSESGDIKLEAAHAIGRWTYSGGLAALYASSSHLTTQQDINAHLQADLALSRHTFWFGTGRWDRNLFDGFAYQESVASGLGRILVMTNATKLSVELGAGFRRERPELLTTNALGAVTSRVRRPVVDDAVVHAGAQYRHSISSSTHVLDTLLVESGSSDTMTTDNLSLQVKMEKTLSLAVGVQLTNNTNPPPGSVRHTDTVMTVNLVYEFKNSKLTATSGSGDSFSDLIGSLNMP